MNTKEEIESLLAQVRKEIAKAEADRMEARFNGNNKAELCYTQKHRDYIWFESKLLSLTKGVEKDSEFAFSKELDKEL